MLLQRNIVKKYLSLLDEELITKVWEKYSSYFLNEDIQANIQKIKEEQFQEGFLRELFVKVLGYTINPSPNYNLTTELKIEVGSKKADAIRASIRTRVWSLSPTSRNFDSILTMR